MLKLDIIRRYLRGGALFVHYPNVKQIFIYGMFSGSATGSKGNPGSPYPFKKRL